MILSSKRKKCRESDLVDVLGYQVSVFFYVKQERPDKLWYRLSQEISDIIDVVPTIVPVPIDAPDEIPIVNATSTNGVFGVNISKIRADLIINIRPDMDEELKGLAAMRAFQFVEGFKGLVDIKRIGIVGRFVMEEVNSVGKINTKLFDGKFSNAVELSARINNRETLKGLLLNNIIEIQTVEMINQEETIKKQGILIVRDINNVDTNMALAGEKFQEIIEYAFDNYSEENIRELI